MDNYPSAENENGLKNWDFFLFFAFFLSKWPINTQEWYPLGFYGSFFLFAYLTKKCRA